VVLRIPPEYGTQWRNGEPAVVELLHDASRQNAQTPYERVKLLITSYGHEMGALRLLARGVAPVVGTPLAIAERDLSTAQSRAGLLLAILPYFLVLSIFVGGMYLAIDVTAGERERQSLEPLLLNPVSRDQIVIGKLCAISLYSLLSAIISIIAFAICLRFVPTADLGFDLQLSPHTALMIWLTAAPLAPVAAALQTLTAARTKTFREAQSYLQVMMLIPLVPSLMQIINPAKPPDWMYSLPIFNQSLLIGELTHGDKIAISRLALSWSTTLALALVLAIGAVAAYRKERVAFG
jgi:sodium transport system permease protein